LVGVPFACHGTCDARQETVQIEAVERSQQALRQREIEHQKMSVSTEDPPHLAQSRRPVRHITQTKGNGHDIEASGRKRQLERISYYRVRQALAPRHGQHFRAKIGARDFRFRHLPSDRQGEIATPGGKIEHPPRTPLPNDVRGAPTPPEIKPDAEQMIGQIITPRDTAKHGPNSLRIALGLGWVKRAWFGHLSATTGRKPIRVLKS
jgi:hypothetical protein